MPIIELDYNITKSQIKIIKTIFDFAITLPSLFLIYPFIYFKTKLAKTQSDFSKFILSLPKIISGKYSLVGPQYLEGQKNLFLGKKGLTGYWYIESLNPEESDKMDFYYAKNQNVWIDIDILIKTLIKMWSKD
jgi:lipopolysaccharide/colanic/teichoic acid biosynthesis glycosyltransferase